MLFGVFLNLCFINGLDVLVLWYFKVIVIMMIMDILNILLYILEIVMIFWMINIILVLNYN